MGNEQSTSNESSGFSFLSKAGSRKGKGVVVVKDGNVKQATVEEDEIYKRFQEIPRFLPILKHAIGKKDNPTDSLHRMSSRPMFKFSLRLQEHLNICAKVISNDQVQIGRAIKKVDSASGLIAVKLKEKKVSHDMFLKTLHTLPRLLDEVTKITLLLEELVPVAETLNELLLPESRLEHFNIERVLERSPTSSSESSVLSTPRRTIPPVEEISVVDVE